MPVSCRLVLAGISGLLVTACVPSVPITPSPATPRPATTQPIPATVAVVVEPTFLDARFERHEPGEPGSSVKVNIGASSLELVKVVLGPLFERVEVVGSAADAAGAEFLVYPRIMSAYATQYDPPYGDVLASIAYRFTFVRPTDQQTVDTLEVTGAGRHARSTAWVLPDFLLAIGTLGAWHGTSMAVTVSRAFAQAQERAFSALITQLPTSAVATEATRLRSRR
jgi:hypothetical protein